MKELIQILGKGGILLLGILLGACSGSSTSDLNPNFPNLSGDGLQAAFAMDASSFGQVIDVAPSFASETGPKELSGALGLIADQEPEDVLCVLIDGVGGNADLEVCNADDASAEAASADAICPNEAVSSSCSSSRGGEGPDFCEVTGATDYVFALINRSDTEVRVAYQVIDVSQQPNKSCKDLNIDEDSIKADTF